MWEGNFIVEHFLLDCIAKLPYLITSPWLLEIATSYEIVVTLPVQLSYKYYIISLI